MRGNLAGRRRALIRSWMWPGLHYKTVVLVARGGWRGQECVGWLFPPGEGRKHGQAEAVAMEAESRDI